MNTKTIFAAATLALIGTCAIAGEVSEFVVPTGSTLTRAEVRADLARSHTAQNVAVRGESYGNVQNILVAQRPVAGQVAALSRSDVKSELARSRADRTVVAGEAYGTVVPGASLRTRAEVRAETVANMRGAQVEAIQTEASGN